MQTHVKTYIQPIKTNRDNVVMTHAAHGDEWLGSIDGAVALIKQPGVRDPTTWIGDFNADRNSLLTPGPGDEAERWRAFERVCSTLGFKQGIEESGQRIYTRGPRGNQYALPSWIHHVAIPVSSSAQSRVSSECIPGDHSWVISELDCMCV